MKIRYAAHAGSPPNQKEGRESFSAPLHPPGRTHPTGRCPTTLVKVIRENLYTERDERCLDEYLCYEKKPNGAFGAITGKHDDLLMTRAIGLHICFFEMEIPKIVLRIGRFVVKKKKAVSAATI